jgi:hypothetical protein
MGGGELELIPGRDLGDPMRFQAVKACEFCKCRKPCSHLDAAIFQKDH